MFSHICQKNWILLPPSELTTEIQSDSNFLLQSLLICDVVARYLVVFVEH